MPPPHPQRLVDQTVSDDTRACAEQLLEGVNTGQVVGAVIGILYRRRRYSVVVCGEAQLDPTYARGVTCAIDDELHSLIHPSADAATTL